jgi:hypothetical protein
VKSIPLLPKDGGGKGGRRPKGRRHTTTTTKKKEIVEAVVREKGLDFLGFYESHLKKRM